MVYHSNISLEESSIACGCALAPLRTQVKGPASTTQGVDIVDEAISFYRANVLFRNFDVQGPADKSLVYLELSVGQLLKRFDACKTKVDGAKMVTNLVLEPFLLPGDHGFALGGFLSAPANRQEGEMWRSYFKQAREELGLRLLDKCYTNEGSLNKYWMAFSSRKFLNKQL
mmetsp:Transcript_40040/g.55642  ORF Transcript_40040/g.55642 Transcript_40040/m.55642 type:complete len:171 (+) Transcript_40040:224-736(+)|eukprot:CAMPEP_0196571154 /NCGR_PEP_ID=MMETSP1081-20130531/1322_1 /TAXON_ID=36882 /ORGANISM="Pyramimonas amylifera, Strain CCMP720" /LENGTH=170 /DNA_ID=CAMNT_0041887967 /DNA_START=199 /DNA_END=711 /DNA_ORIENTATION=+